VQRRRACLQHIIVDAVVGDRYEAGFAGYDAFVLSVTAGGACWHDLEAVRLNDLNNFPKGAF